jgi:predicted nucleotidyltransferase
MALSRDRAEYIALLEHTLTRLVATLGRMEEVERVSTFGSYARGRRDLLTDLDILIVMDTEREFVDRVRMLYECLAAPVDVDLLCYTPREFQALRDSPFLRHTLFMRRSA